MIGYLVWKNVNWKFFEKIFGKNGKQIWVAYVLFDLFYYIYIYICNPTLINNFKSDDKILKISSQYCHYFYII